MTAVDDRVTSSEHAGHTAFLVEARPGVWVVEDYYTPIFFGNGVFWRWEKQGWARAASWDGPFCMVALGELPSVLRSLDDPAEFALFHGAPSCARQPIPKSGA